MDRSLKIALYLLFFGALTFLSAVFVFPHKSEYSKEEILGTSVNTTVFVEPEEGTEPILERLKSAQHQVLVVVYILSDQEIIDGLIGDEQRGIDVKVLLDEKPFGGGNLNQKSKTELESAGIQVRWTNKKFTFTHQKTMIFDGVESCILSLNLTTSAFSKNREFGVCTDQPQQVQEISSVFWADWNGAEINPTQSNLIFSPNNSRAKLESLLDQAKKSIDIVMEAFDDQEVTNIVKNKASSVNVRVIFPPPEKVLSNKATAEQIEQNGGWVKKISNPYMHAKLIIVDGERAYVGSVNLTKNSMENNRELGIILSQTDVVAKLQSVFESDWQNGSDY